jgi:hypothetical protein
VRRGGEVTGVKGGSDLEESYAGREMESSSSSIAEVIVSGFIVEPLQTVRSSKKLRNLVRQ